MRIHPRLILAALLLNVGACAVFHPIELQPEPPRVKKIPAKATLLLEPFVDGRPRGKDWTPEWTGQWRNHRFVFDRPVAEKAGGLIQDLLEKSGYLVLTEGPGSADESTPVLGGKLEEMEANLREEAFNPYAPLVCKIRLRLSLKKSGKLLAQKTLDVQHQRRGFSVLSDASYQKVVNETFEKFLDEAADFIESGEFRNAIAP